MLIRMELIRIQSHTAVELCSLTRDPAYREGPGDAGRLHDLLLAVHRVEYLEESERERENVGATTQLD